MYSLIFFIMLPYSGAVMTAELSNRSSPANVWSSVKRSIVLRSHLLFLLTSPTIQLLSSTVHLRINCSGFSDSVPRTPQLREDYAHGPSISRLAVFNYRSSSLPCSSFSYNHVSADSSDRSCQNFSYQEEGDRSFGVDTRSCVERVLQQTRFDAGFCASSANIRKNTFGAKWFGIFPN